jgi:hypothetical protein
VVKAEEHKGVRQSAPKSRVDNKTRKTRTTMADEVATMCANCGKAEQLEVKLKTCLACKLVKY